MTVDLSAAQQQEHTNPFQGIEGDVASISQEVIAVFRAMSGLCGGSVDKYTPKGITLTRAVVQRDSLWLAKCGTCVAFCGRVAVEIFNYTPNARNKRAKDF